MKTFAAIFVLSCFGVCFSENVQEWGQVELALFNYKIDSESIFVQAQPDAYQVREVTFSDKNITFPDSHHGRGYVAIEGVRHINHDDQSVEVTFLEGEQLEHEESVKLLVKSQFGHGINSTFEFYGLVAVPRS